jgi:AcrR family transcriptional regulator
MDKPGIDPALARQRLLDAADELFYRQGMHRVSIDRVIEKAGVPAETLREAFGSTDELVRHTYEPVTPGCRTRSRANSPVGLMGEASTRTST